MKTILLESFGNLLIFINLPLNLAYFITKNYSLVIEFKVISIHL